MFSIGIATSTTAATSSTSKPWVVTCLKGSNEQLGVTFYPGTGYPGTRVPITPDRGVLLQDDFCDCDYQLVQILAAVMDLH
eukprot:3433971-Rhodomonas_salina.2